MAVTIIIAALVVFTLLYVVPGLFIAVVMSALMTAVFMAVTGTFSLSFFVLMVIVMLIAANQLPEPKRAQRHCCCGCRSSCS